MREVTKLKDWQVGAFQSGRPARYFLIQSPGGAGKSLLQVLLAQADIEDTGNKQLILVPKNHIHHGFYDEESIKLVLPGQDNPSHWVVRSNFCSVSKSEAKTRLLREFLLADVRQLRQEGRLAAIATHKAMVSAWNSLSDLDKKLALRSISFRVDESHHLSNVFHESDLCLFNLKDKEAILEDATQLGQFLQEVLLHDDGTVKVHLATATFFRGDRRTILSDRFKDEFSHYYLPWDEHFKELGIDRLFFDFINYEGDPVRPLIDMIRKEPAERHLIIIPALTRRYRTQDSHGKILRGLAEIFPDREILDLVSPSTQEANKRLLHRFPGSYRVVIACRLFDEGTDWVPCTRLHNTDACESSVTLAVQRFFRPLRSHPEKRVVKILNYIPDMTPEMTLEEKRQILSNRLNAFLACIVTQGELVPTLVTMKGIPKGKQPRRMSLQEVYGSKYPEVMADLLKRYELVGDKSDSASIEDVAETVLAKHGVPDEVEPCGLRNALLSQLIRIAHPKSKVLERENLEPKGIDAEAIREKGFDKVWEKVAPVPSVLCYGSDNIDGALIRQLLDIVHEVPSLDEIHQAIRSFSERTGKRPTFHQSEWMTELSRSASAVDKILRRHYETTLAQEVRTVLGDSNDDLLAKTHDLIREYWARGIRIGNKFGDLPEISMSSFALNGRLSWNHGTTLAKEVDKILGPQTKPLTLPKVRQVINSYLKKGVRLHRKFGDIPELGMSSYNLADRLKRNFSVTLTELVDEVASTMAR
jgi:hypothetical protein